jgi:dolichol-phosphate mannosyltransferase
MRFEIPAYEIHEIQPKRTTYCVGIPIINEGEKIKNQLRSMKALDLDRVADILIFDGGSRDGSTDLGFLRSCGVRTLLVKTGPGKQGAQFRMGFAYLLGEGYEGVVTIDGNGKDSVENIPDFIEALQGGYDFVQGSRFVKGGAHINTPLSRLMAIKLLHAPWISLLAGFPFTDTTSAYRGLSRKLLLDERLHIFRNIFSSYELIFYMSTKAPRLGYHTTEIPVTRQYPKGNVPTKIKFLDNLNILGTLMKLSAGHYDRG